MKIWIFALLQSIIAAMGLAAYFLADNMLLASTAAMLAAALGVAQPLLSAHKAGKFQQYQDEQYDKSLEVVDKQLDDLLDGAIDPPLPQRAVIAAVLTRRFSDQSARLLQQYDHLAEAIESDGDDATALAATLASHVADWSAGPYLEGLAALSAGNIASAHERFTAATQLQSDWVAPWLGWATTAHQQGDWDEIRQYHPHINGVQMLPYCCGDEQTFLDLSEPDREALTESFQQAATSLGNYYAIAEYCHSKRQMAETREEYKRVA